MKVIGQDWARKIVVVLRGALEPRKDVFALWITGSMAQGKGDEDSDLDIWVSIADGSEEKVYIAVKETLASLGKLDIDHRMQVAHPKIFHNVYHVADTPDAHTIDVNLQYQSQKIKLTKGVDDYVAIFDKKGDIQVVMPKKSSLDWKKALERASQYVKLQKPNILKNLERGQILEAQLYYRYLIEFLLKLVRNKYTPNKTEYGFKHVSRDLPKKYVTLFEKLTMVKNAEDIQSGLKMVEAFITSVGSGKNKL